jgi:hypothetical protein
MISNNLQGIAELVVRRARRQGFVAPEEVREECIQAGAPENLWQDVVALARPALALRRGRYYYTDPVSDRVRREQLQQRGVRRAVRQLIRQARPDDAGGARVERRVEDRVEFVQAVTVRTENGQEFSLQTRDLSASGVRLVGPKRLLGQKVHVLFPRPDGQAPLDFLVRILWTCAVGEGLYENGGAFIEVSAPVEAAPAKM